MLIIKARELKIGDQFKSGSTIQEVMKISKVSDKSIEFFTKRIAPDYYDANGNGLFHRPTLNKNIVKVN